MSNSSDNIVQATPPWQLTGSGIILLYRFPREFIAQHGSIPPFLDGHHRGGFGALMLVDYDSSPVGPYREALFIPGTFDYDRRRYYAITWIAVSTLASVVNGRQNWGIPKQIASFNVENLPNGAQRFSMHVDDQPALDAHIRARGPRLPFNTRWLPFRPTLIQQRDDGQLLTTAPYGSGHVRLARLQHLRIHADTFPDISQFRPLAVIHATDFNLCFPVPDSLPTREHHATQ